MNILVVQETDWIRRGPHNTHHLMERLSARGHNVKVIDYEVLWKESKNEGSLISKREVFYNQHKSIKEGNVTVVRPSIIKLSGLNYFSLIYTHKKEIKNQINTFKPDIIVNVGNLLNGYLTQRLANEKGIPVVYFIMDTIHKLVPERCFQPLAYYIERSNMRNSRWVVSINKSLREYTVSMGAEEKNTMVLRTGVDLSRFMNNFEGKKIRAKYGIKDNETVLFFMGWLYTFSGLRELALEIAKSRKKYQNIKLLILGNGDLWDELQSIIRRHSLEDIIITIGWQPYDDVPAYLDAVDICLLPAYENATMKYIVPIKIYEYMASGKPIIATKLYGLVTEFGYDNGVFYVENSESVLDKVVDLIKNVDLNREGNKTLKFVQRSDWCEITNDFESFLYGCIENKGKYI